MSNNYTRDVMGKTSDGATVTIGRITGEFPLSSKDFELLTLDVPNGLPAVETTLNPEHYRATPLTLAREVGGGGDFDLVSPIISIRSKLEYHLNVMVSKHISRVLKTEESLDGLGNIGISITSAGTREDRVINTYIFIPAEVNLRTKIIHVPVLDIYIGGSRDQLENIRARGIVTQPREGYPKSICDIHVRGNTTVEQELHYIFQGIPGKVRVEYADEPVATVTVEFPDSGETIEREFPNDQLIEMDRSLYVLSDRFGGSTLVLDHDRDRLNETWIKAKGEVNGRDQDTAEMINKLRSDNNKLRDQLQDEKEKTKKKIYEKEASITDLKCKLSEVSSDAKLKQEDSKTKREEVRYVSAQADTNAALVSTTLKVGGSLLGFGVLTFTLLNKFSSSSGSSKLTAGMVEWALPLFETVSPAMGASMAGASTGATLVAGLGVAALAIGAVVGLVGKSRIKSAIDKTGEVISDAIEATCDAVSDAWETTKKGGRWVKNKVAGLFSGVKSLCWW